MRICLAIQFACDSSSDRQSSRSLSASCGSSRTVMDLRLMVRGLRPAPLRAPPLVGLGVMGYLSWLNRVRHLLGDSCARVNNTVRRKASGQQMFADHEGDAGVIPPAHVAFSVWVFPLHHHGAAASYRAATRSDCQDFVGDSVSKLRRRTRRGSGNRRGFLLCGSLFLRCHFVVRLRFPAYRPPVAALDVHQRFRFRGDVFQFDGGRFAEASTLKARLDSVLVWSVLQFA